MGGVVGGVTGYFASENQRLDAERARQDALNQWLGLNAPSVREQELNFQNYQNAGDYQAQLEQALAMGPSAMENVSVDPRLAEAQMAALNQLSQTGQMGMTPGEAAALAQAQQNAAAQAQAKSAQLQDEFARRGMGGSGAELASRLSNAQAAAQMLASNSNDIAQNAQQNALQALAQSGSLAGQMSGQQFGQQSDIARAKDYINQFNTQNAQNVQNANVQAANNAAMRNLTNQQNLMNQNTQLQNQQQQYNKGLIQQQFNNQAALAAGRSGQYQGIAQQNQQNAARTADMWAGIGQGLDTGAGAAYKYWGNNGGSGSDTGGFSQDEENAWLDEGIE